MLFEGFLTQKGAIYKKYIPFLFFVLTVIFLLSSCDGYNFVMRDHLGEIENYTTYECEFVAFEDDGRALVVSLLDAPNDNDNMKYNHSFDDAYQKTVSFLEIIDPNVEILQENGFGDKIQPGDLISIKASSFIYMDGNFFYVIAVRSEEKAYLTEEVGLENMIAWMEERQGLL